MKFFTRKAASGTIDTGEPFSTRTEQARRRLHGTPCDAALLAELALEIRRRRRETDTIEGPDAPTTNGLEIRREGLPDWWDAGGNLMLAAPDTSIVRLETGFGSAPPTNAVVILGRGSRLHNLDMTGEAPLVAIGDHANLHSSGINAMSGATVLIGEHTTSTMLAHMDARNGGIIIVGADGMWAHGVGFMTDDMHAIRDVGTGHRLNTFGGRIVVGRHVWLGEHVKILNGSRIGAETVVGLGSFVKNAALPPNSICVGRPAKPIRSNTTWSREDLP